MIRGKGTGFVAHPDLEEDIVVGGGGPGGGGARGVFFECFF